MSKPAKTFNDYVIEGVLAKSGYDIAIVNNLGSVKDLYFVREEYADVLAFIKAGNVELIQQSEIPIEGFKEYLTIMKFTDQNNNAYMVTVYDNDELLQDPKVMDVVPQTAYT
jgi:hypothetical protein